VGRYDGLVIVAPMLERSNWRFADLIDAPASSEAMVALRGVETLAARSDPPTFLGQSRGAHGARSEATKAGTETDNR
jgi:hypothetical protein